MLVEDDRQGRLLYAGWLRTAGFHVEEAHNGLQALERAFEVRPSLVVTDLDIPGIDGFELTRRAGCDTVLRKLCGADDLYSSINDLMRQRAENR